MSHKLYKTVSKANKSRTLHANKQLTILLVNETWDANANKICTAKWNCTCPSHFCFPKHFWVQPLLQHSENWSNYPIAFFAYRYLINEQKISKYRTYIARNLSRDENTLTWRDEYCLICLLTYAYPQNDSHWTKTTCDMKTHGGL